LKWEYGTWEWLRLQSLEEQRRGVGEEREGFRSFIGLRLSGSTLSSSNRKC
jgi:hypothetical protein